MDLMYAILTKLQCNLFNVMSSESESVPYLVDDLLICVGILTISACIWFVCVDSVLYLTVRSVYFAVMSSIFLSRACS